MHGFGLRTTPSGSKGWILDYGSGSGRHRMTLGQFPDLSADAARDLAVKYRADIRRGEDPLARREADRLTLSAAPTMRELANDWMHNHAALKKRPASQALDKTILEKHVLPALGEQTRVADVTFAEIDALHRKLVRKGTPVIANRTVTLLAAMFKQRAIRKGWRKDNPASGIERVREQSRERYLTLDEWRRLEGALAKSRNRESARAVKLLIATGSRRGEVLSAEWSQVNLATGVWTRPAHFTKQAKTSTIPLNAMALAVLREMWAEREAARARGHVVSEFLFPGAPGKPQADLKKFWSRVKRDADIEDVRLHDLRHSFASFLVSRGVPLFTIGALLGHTQSRTTQRYAHLDVDVLRAASESVSATLTLPEPEPGPGSNHAPVFDAMREAAAK